MSLTYESADLILKLYDMRREEMMRRAREWYRTKFFPESTEEVIAALRGPASAYYRMVTSYWEMAASFVTNGAIDWKMFMDASAGEPIAIFVKHEPFLADLRATFDSKHEDGTYLGHLEKLVMHLPNAREVISERREQLKQARARLQASGASETPGAETAT